MCIMKDMKKKTNENRITTEETLNLLYISKKSAPKALYWILFFLYLFTSFIIGRTAGSTETILIAGIYVPVYTFAGVLSSLSNICIILLAVYYEKRGIITAFALVIFNIPFILKGIFFGKSITSLPGIFGSILMLVTLIFIALNNKKVSDYQKVLRSQAVTDILTGLPNWFAGTELINALIDRKEPFAAVSIDINGFKSINDTMGFESGNKVLIDISQKWKAIVDSGSTGTADFICRLNGDEFSLIIRNFSSEEDIVNTIKHYDHVMDSQMSSMGYDFYLSASYGYSVYPDDADNIDDILSKSVIAMKECKRTGRSENILKFTPELQKDSHSLEQEGKLRSALDNNGIFFVLQPQYDMSHNLRGFEALARMRDEDGNIIPPVAFIPLAEKIGLIDRIDSAVFRKSAAFIGGIIKQTGLDITLSINISVRHLMKKDFPDEIKKELAESGLPVNNLEIEITESIMIESMEKAMDCIEELRKMGVKIAIDDFGTGYSSLSYLNNIPANLLKVDKSFIDAMNSSEKSKQYVAAIISLGHIMGYKVISEGVEEDDQLQTLRKIGCDYIQGYIWGKPLPQEEVEKLITQVVSH